MPAFELSTEQKNEYFSRGYTAIKGGISPELLKRLQTTAKRFEEDVLDKHKKGISISGACVVKNNNIDSLFRYNDIHGIDWDMALDLLSSPAMMAVFRDICGKGAVPLMMDILYKRSNENSVVLWHQDAPYSKKYPYLNIGIYLDDSDIDDGCLRYVPNTQSEKLDIHKLSQEFGWEIPNSVEFPAKAGDINIHDMMILHGSKQKTTSNPRRTIYVEVRPYDAIIDEGLQSLEWADLRKRFMALVLRRADPSDWPDEWMDDYPTDLKSDKEEIEMILQKREPVTPANYAFPPVKNKNYPIPEDHKECS